MGWHKDADVPNRVICEKNDVLELEILNMGNGGEGIGKVDGYTLFVKGALAGDRVRVKVIKTKKHFGYAKLLEVLVPSKDRVEAVCAVAGKCGGCQLQHCSYERQLRYKEEKVRDCLERIGGFHVRLPEENFLENQREISGETREYVQMEPVLSMDFPYHYRNKAQFPVGTDKDGNLITGFYAGRTHQIIPNTNCVIQHPCNQVILETVMAFMEKYHIPAYDEVSHRGLVRHILIRVGRKTGEVMICLVINGKKLPYSEKLVEWLLAIDFANEEITSVFHDVSGKFQKKGGGTAGDLKIEEVSGKLRIKSICININTEKTNAILGKEIMVLYGQGYIEDFIGDIKFQISPLSFYQVNPLQTEKLYRTALDFAELSGGEVVWDLYCGIGTISLFLAQKAGKVCGVEIVPQAVEDAKKNAELNGIKNAEFFCGAAEETVPQIYEKSGGTLKADVVMLDPPRKGCEEKLLETVLKMEPEKIVYVSCDPATLARDLKFLCARGYVLKRVRACDMFSQSGHVETVVCLIRSILI